MEGHLGMGTQDTDCFQVVFYANYFRFFQRALNEVYAKDVPKP